MPENKLAHKSVYEALKNKKVLFAIEGTEDERNGKPKRNPVQRSL